MAEEPEPKQIQLMRRMVEMSVTRTQLAAERTYMNAERTLAVWVRTAMGLMAFGIALDRFGLLLDGTNQAAGRTTMDVLSAWGGVTLIATAVLMALLSGLRFLAYVSDYRDRYTTPTRHGPFLGPFFALLVAIFGVVLLGLLLFFTPSLQY